MPSNITAQMAALSSIAMAIVATGAMGCGTQVTELAELADAGADIDAAATGLGTRCTVDEECAPNAQCCTSVVCGGGTCSLECSSDRDCPDDALCHGGQCLVDCRSDGSCLSGLQCRGTLDRRVCAGGDDDD